MEDYVQLNEQYQVLICRPCRAAIRPFTSIETHFRQQHQLKGPILRDIRDYYGSLQLNDPTSSELPPDGSAAVEFIEVSHGYSCDKCEYLTAARDNLTRHKRESGHHSPVGTPLTEVRLQSWMGGRFARYWIVRDENAQAQAQAQDGPDTDATSKSTINQMIAEIQTELAAEDAQRLRKGDLEEGIDRDSTWVKRVGWARHFGTRDLLDIYEAAEWIRAKRKKAQRDRGRGGEEEDEQAAHERRMLLRLGESFDREVDRCSWRLDSVPTETL